MTVRFVVGDTPTVLAAHDWPTNAALIADVAKLGYLDGCVLDCAYGLGGFWKLWVPEAFTYSDLLTGVDFRAMPWADDTFGAVVFDPPYKLNGTDQGEGERYGVHLRASWQERMQLCRDGATECVRVLKPGGFLLWKCQDQVCSGKIRWQTIDFTDHAAKLGLELVDRFDMLGTARPQPSGRKQVHAHGRPSTLLVFRKSHLGWRTDGSK